MKKIWTLLIFALACLFSAVYVGIKASEPGRGELWIFCLILLMLTLFNVLMLAFLALADFDGRCEKDKEQKQIQETKNTVESESEDKE
ncbi:MAG: hypothetical protein Q8N63_02705 [Nanoarchaeota archaeon]|nr:hypothetical protein [Nanoarchaeota archaeon]